jgi:hypothetical protein
MSWQALRDHLSAMLPGALTALAGAALVGGGNTIIGNKVELGRHDERLIKLERLGDKIDTLGGKIDAFDDKLDRTREELIRRR